MNNQKTLRILCGIVAAWFAGTGIALAQANDGRVPTGSAAVAD